MHCTVMDFILFHNKLILQYMAGDIHSLPWISIVSLSTLLYPNKRSWQTQLSHYRRLLTEIKSSIPIMQYCYECNSLIAILHTTIVIVIIIVKLKLWSMLYMLKKWIQLDANILDANTWPMVQCQIWHANYAAFQWTTYFFSMYNYAK